MIPVSYGNAGIGRGGYAGGNARDNFKRDTGGRQLLCFFTSTAENEWISTFQPDDSFAFTRLLDEELIQLILRDGMIG